MGEKMNTTVSNISDMIANGQEDIIESYVQTFSCKKTSDDGAEKSLNPDIERFIKMNAIQFAKMQTAITYFIFDNDDGALLGYYALTHKAMTVSADGLSRQFKDKVKRFSALDGDTNTYTVSAYLIAQIGKNYGVDNGERISGSQLMNLAKQTLMKAKKYIGGKIVYLDCDDNASLTAFYESEGFKLVGERISDNDGRRYLQYMCFL